MKFAFLTFSEAEGAPINWKTGARKHADLVAAAVAAGFSESEVDESPVGVLSRDWSSFRRGARALIGINGSTLLEVVHYQHIALGVSPPLTTAQLLTAFRRLVPAQRRVDLRGTTSESDADIIVDVVAGDETRTLFECCSYAGLEDLGPYPDLRFAVELWRAYGADSYCDFHAFAGPNLPGTRLFLAHVKGQWWVATVVEVPGAKRPGGESIRLVRSVELPGGAAAT